MCQMFRERTGFYSNQAAAFSDYYTFFMGKGDKLLESDAELLGR